MTGARGTVSEIDAEGRYTGALVGDIAHGPVKAKIAEEIAGSRGIEMRDSAAYSDSINDLPLLESVGHPHAVNPDHQLRRIARARGWPIHELRTRRRALPTAACESRTCLKARKDCFGEVPKPAREARALPQSIPNRTSAPSLRPIQFCCNNLIPCGQSSPSSSLSKRSA